MALFKVFRGQRNDLDSVAKVDGHAYFCTDDGSFWVDHQETDEIVRTQINKADWNNDINNAIENLLNSNKIVVNAEITSEKSPFLISKIDENGSRRATLVIGEKGRENGKDFYKLGLQAQTVALQTYTVNEDGNKTTGPGISVNSLTNRISILGDVETENDIRLYENTDDYSYIANISPDQLTITYEYNTDEETLYDTVTLNNGGLIVENGDGHFDIAVDTGFSVFCGDRYASFHSAGLVCDFGDYSNQVIFPYANNEYRFEFSAPGVFSNHTAVFEDMNEGEDGNNAHYGFEGIVYHTDGKYYSFDFPEQSGVIALLSDIPTVTAATNDEILAIFG